MKRLISVQTGDITKLAVDAVVNAANSGLRGGGGVDGAIHRGAGPKLREACRAIGGCPTGEARITPGFELPAAWIVHAVGPVWMGGAHEEARLLRSCYRHAFTLALEHGATSIALPAISTGVYSYPKREAARIAVASMRVFEGEFDEIIACCFDAEQAEIYRALLR